MKTIKNIMYVNLTAAIIITLTGVVPAEGAVMYSNLGPGDSFSTTTVTRASGLQSTWNEESDVAQMFAPGISGYLDSVEVGVLSGLSTYDTVQMDLWIAADNGGVPGAILETASYTMSGYTRGVQKAAFSGNTYLAAGTNYWVAMSASGVDWFWWYASEPPVAGRIGYKTTGNWGAFDYYDCSSLRVNSVPEPATMTLLALGGLGLLRRNKHSI